MALKENGKTISVLANADLSALQDRFININTSGKLVAAANGGDCIGVLLNDPDAANKAGTVQIDGVAKVKVGTGGITAGDNIAADTNGTAITAASGDAILGRALETAAVDAKAAILLVGAKRQA